jgi:hypothetical protein
MAARASVSVLKTVLRCLLLLAGVGFAVYGLYATFELSKLIGSGNYWFSPWWYKAHIPLFAMIAVKIAADWIGEC